MRSKQLLRRPPTSLFLNPLTRLTVFFPDLPTLALAPRRSLRYLLRTPSLQLISLTQPSPEPRSTRHHSSSTLSSSSKPNFVEPSSLERVETRVKSSLLCTERFVSNPTTPSPVILALLANGSPSSVRTDLDLMYYLVRYSSLLVSNRQPSQNPEFLQSCHG